jgi:hypothetical protein
MSDFSKATRTGRSSGGVERRAVPAISSTSLAEPPDAGGSSEEGPLKLFESLCNHPHGRDGSVASKHYSSAIFLYNSLQRRQARRAEASNSDSSQIE